MLSWEVKMTQTKSLSTSAIFLGLALFVVTIIFAQQITNVIFPDENSIRVIAKMVIDTALIAIGLGIHHRVVGAAILYAGVVRFILIFFQLQGMDPSVRIIVIIITIIILFAVGYMKFGKNLTSQQRS